MYKENRTYNRNTNITNRSTRATSNSSGPMLPPSIPPLPPIPVPPFTPTEQVSAALPEEALPSFAMPEVKLPESFTLPSMPELKLPESFTLPSMPDLELPKSVALPSMPELKFPESFTLPAMPELELPKSVALPSLPGLKLPESVALPSFSLEELKFPEIPSLAELEELFSQSQSSTESEKAEASTGETTPAKAPTTTEPKATNGMMQAPPTPLPAKGTPVPQTSPQTMPPQILPPQVIPPQLMPPAQIPSGKYAKIRFLNATMHSPLNILIGTHMVAKSLERGGVSPYAGVLDGFRTITITSPTTIQPVMLRKTLPVKGGEILTIAIIPTTSGIDLLSISDAPCDQQSDSLSCIRMVNLAPASKPLDLLLGDGRVIFADAHYKDVTPFKRIKPGKYRFFVIHTPYQPMPLSVDIESEDATSVTANSLPDQCDMNVLLSFVQDIISKKMYTIYILGRNQADMPMEVLITEN